MGSKKVKVVGGEPQAGPGWEKIRNMIVEVESNPNCEQSFFGKFKEVGPARRVVKVRSYERSSRGEWCWITGWTDREDVPLCPARAQLVEDSGAGLTIIVFGGIGGVRLKPVRFEEDWNLESANQWGETYLSISNGNDLVYHGDSENT